MTTEVSPAVVLTIAGFDPSGGAGITADLKTFAAHGLYGISCVTALTIQSTQGVQRVVPLDAELVTATLECLVVDIPPAGIKIGMLANAAVAHAVANFIAQARIPRNCIVLDPVMAASSGAALIDGEGLEILRTSLLGCIGWVTPNVDELALLLGEARTDLSGIPGQAERLQELAAAIGNRNLRVVVTGGHLEPPDDYFLDCMSSPERPAGKWMRGERVPTKGTHGTGCAFSSALLCHWIHQANRPGALHAEDAVRVAKAYVTEALRQAYPIGHGKGPVNHFFRYRPGASI